ncbi:uncharacterized protein LOC143244108 isoform X2 [Tachypleus tridentatus]|uniref:uncharacterized protein LOC143244108 isoform X2 n=1 Tax=Tachypleus tridentatus TaxID=6853 RepID=UPI003FD4043A
MTSERFNESSKSVKNQRERRRFIYDLPWPTRKELCMVLDADGKWEELGGKFLNYDITKLTLIGKGKSPTDELLNEWGTKNGTINRLYVYLSKMDHQRAMSILISYVDPKYHHLARDRLTTTMVIAAGAESDKSISKSSLTTKLMTSDSQSKSQLSTMFSSYSKSSCSNLGKNSSEHTKCSIDPQNFNYTEIGEAKAAGFLNNKVKKFSPPPKWLTNQESVSCSSKQKDPSSNIKEEQTQSDNCAWNTLCSGAKNKHEKSQVVAHEKKVQNIGKEDNHFNEKKEKIGHKVSGSLSNLEDTLPTPLKIPYKDLLRATEEFSRSRVLGQGGFGVVYRGEWKGNFVAVKRLMVRGQDSTTRQQVSLKQSLNEMKILYSCRIDNILPLYGVSLDGPEPCLVYQFMVNGSLEDRLLLKKNTPPLTWLQRGNIAEGTAKGLNYLHTLSCKLIHGDIKSANILLDANMEPKIGDFGLTREGPSGGDTHVKVSKVHGTQVYLPPEYLRSSQLSTKVDVYSYGIVLLELATGLRAFDSKRTEFKYLVEFVGNCSREKIATLKDVKAGDEYSDWYPDLLHQGQRCASKLKKDRPEMAEVLVRLERSREQVVQTARIRKLSLEKESLEPESMRLTPMQLQIFYDIRKEVSLHIPGAGTSSGSERRSSVASTSSGSDPKICATSLSSGGSSGSDAPPSYSKLSSPPNVTNTVSNDTLKSVVGSCPQSLSELSDLEEYVGSATSHDFSSPNTWKTDTQNSTFSLPLLTELGRSPSAPATNLGTASTTNSVDVEKERKMM